MRSVILTLLLALLIAAKSYAVGMVAAHTSAGGGNYNVSTFEGPSSNGWNTAYFQTDVTDHHNGSYCFSFTQPGGTSGYVDGGTSKSLDTRAGYLDFWYKTTEDLYGGQLSVVVNGNTFFLAKSLAWTHSTDIPVPAGGNTSIAFFVDYPMQFTFTAFIDDVKIPVP